jgi:hypothetical protein
LNDSLERTKLRQMNAPRRFALVGLTFTLLGFVGCERAKEPAPAASVVGDSTIHPDSTHAIDMVPQSWPTSLGPMLLVGADAAARATLVAADSTSRGAAFPQGQASARVVLFGRDRRIQIATLAAAQSSATSCWTGTIRSGGGPLRPWTVGFAADSIHPVPLDSILGLSHADSAALISEAARLASVMPSDSTGVFFGLPFIVDALWRFTLPGDTQVVIATLHRQINQEAMPLEERTLIVAEHDSSTDGGLVSAYSERSSGDEETVEAHDLLGAIMTGAPQHPMLVFARDFGDGVSYAFIERTGPRQWRLRWTSPRRKCPS